MLDELEGQGTDPLAAGVTPRSVAESPADPPTSISRSATDSRVVVREGAGVTTSGSVTQSLAAAWLPASPE